MFYRHANDAAHVQYISSGSWKVLVTKYCPDELTLRAAISEGKPCIIRTISLKKTYNIIRKSQVIHSLCGYIQRPSCSTVQQVIPWSSSTGPLGSPSVPSSVVLSDPALRVHSKANVNPAFKFRIGAVQHVHTKEPFYLDYHCRRKSMEWAN